MNLLESYSMNFYFQFKKSLIAKIWLFYHFRDYLNDIGEAQLWFSSEKYHINVLLNKMDHI